MNSSLVQEYIDMVTNLLSPPNLYNAVTDKESYDQLNADLNLIHCALGVSGEALELSLANDNINFKEELGDICFYTVGVLIHRQKKIENSGSLVDGIYSYVDSMITGGPSSVHRLLTACELVNNYVKKLVFYRQLVLKNGVPTHIALFDGSLAVLKEIHLFHPLPEIMQANMEKLLKGENARYKSGKFSTEEATMRRDKTDD